MARILLICIAVFFFCATSAFAGARTVKEWEFETPGHNFIGHNDIFFHKGVVIYDKNQRTYASFVRHARFYPGYVAGESAEGFFLFDEDRRSVSYYDNAEALKEAIRERQLLPMPDDIIREKFNLGSLYVPLIALLYLPILFCLSLLSLRRDIRSTRKQLQIASFLTVEGIVLSVCVLWLMIGIGGMFMTLNFKGERFDLDIIVNASVMLLALASIWLMLYLNDEITKGEWPKLVLTSRLLSFIGFAVFAFWMASAYFTPVLPSEYWQGSF